MRPIGSPAARAASAAGADQQDLAAEHGPLQHELEDDRQTNHDVDGNRDAERRGVERRVSATGRQDDLAAVHGLREAVDEEAGADREDDRVDVPCADDRALHRVDDGAERHRDDQRGDEPEPERRKKRHRADDRDRRDGERDERPRERDERQAERHDADERGRAEDRLDVLPGEKAPREQRDDDERQPGRGPEHRENLVPRAGPVKPR